MTAFANVNSVVQGTSGLRTSPTTVTVGPWIWAWRAIMVACCWPARKAARARASAVLFETQPANKAAKHKQHPKRFARTAALEPFSFITKVPSRYSPGRLRILPNSLSVGSISMRVAEGLPAAGREGWVVFSGRACGLAKNAGNTGVLGRVSAASVSGASAAWLGRAQFVRLSNQLRYR